MTFSQLDGKVAIVLGAAGFIGSGSRAGWPGRARTSLSSTWPVDRAEPSRKRSPDSGGRLAWEGDLSDIFVSRVFQAIAGPWGARRCAGEYRPHRLRYPPGGHRASCLTSGTNICRAWRATMRFIRPLAFPATSGRRSNRQPSSLYPRPRRRHHQSWLCRGQGGGCSR